MREIKFRFWCKELLEIVNMQEIGVDEDGSWWYLKCDDDEKPHYVTSELEIMQYTGLKDKNGREIYEGDVYRMPTGKVGLVFFHIDGGWLIETKKREFSLRKINSQGKSEVIGNIYENPELLEVEQ